MALARGGGRVKIPRNCEKRGFLQKNSKIYVRTTQLEEQGLAPTYKQQEGIGGEKGRHSLLKARALGGWQAGRGGSGKREIRSEVSKLLRDL